ncbi:Transposable element Tcb1 transposase, partial [Camponotus floridanus]
ILVWGCFSWAGVGNLVKINGIMTADVYIDIINENLEECLLKLGLEDNFIFQQDNDSKHTAKKSQAFFRSCRIKQLEWPPQSPDLNPIENFWAILDNRINKSGVTNKNSYFEALQLAWENLDPQHLKNLIESIPKRLQKVIEAKGNHIN